MTSLAAQRLADCDRRMSLHLGELARNLWGVGQVCIEVDRHEAYREAGFASVFEWAATRHKSSRRTIEKAMAVATHFNAEMAEQHVAVVRVVRDHTSFASGLDRPRRLRRRLGGRRCRGDRCGHVAAARDVGDRDLFAS